MSNRKTIELILTTQEMFYDDMRLHFKGLGDGRCYTSQQIEYAIEKIDEYGIRATSRILQLPRRTLQRWCRKYNIAVRRCPYWVYEWAKRRRKKREFWARRRY